MTNISCPQCGSENPLQSKYCNRCGASFSTDTTHICPECSSPNPINLLYCDNCGTRLVDDTAPAGEQDDSDDTENKHSNRSEPFSLPERPPGQTGNLDVSAVLPDWLKTGDFSGDLGPDDSEDLPWLRAAGEDEAWSDEEAPTLEDLSRDHAPRDDLPTWLLDEETAGAIFSGEKSTDELFMSSPGDNDDADEEQSGHRLPNPEETAAEIQGWLNDLDSEEPAQAEEDGEAIEPDDAPLSSSAASSEMPEDDFLQWLSEIQQDSTEDEAEPSSEVPAASVFHDDLPEEADLLEENADDRDSTLEQDSSLESAGPDWLLELSEDEISPDSTEAISQETSDAPDWLVEPLVDESKEFEEILELSEHAPFNLDDGVSDQDSSDAYDASESEGEPTPEPQHDEFLHWLDSLGSDEKATETQEQLAATEPDSETQVTDAGDLETFSSEDDFKLPDWLGGLSDHDEASTIPEASDIDALPDWLQDLTLPGDELALPYVSGTAPETNEDDHVLDENVVDIGESNWLQEEKDANEGDLPDWIAAVTTELDELEDDSGPPSGADTLEGGWPSEPAEEAKFDVTDMALGDNQVSGDDLPDWFSDVMDDIKTDERDSQQNTAAELPDVPQQLAGTELPDWLDSPFIDEEAAEPTPLEEIPEWLRAPLKERLARAAEERGMAEPELDSGEEWRELLEAPLTTEDSSEQRVPDSVPAWLESLRASAREHAGKDAISDGLESSSPVAGIEGAIGIAPVVAQAARRTLDHAHSTATVTSGKEQEQQILLLRQMARLQQDEMNVAAVSTETTRSLPTATRLLLTLLLLVMVVAGLVGGDLVRDFAPSTSSDGLEATLSGIVTDSADRPVLLVFDYTPSTAGALDPLAHRLLQDLSEGNSTILVASQSAAGLALANRATASSAPSSRNIGFIPGDALGVRRLGRCLAQNAACQSLFGQDVESESLRLLAESSNVVVFTADRDSLLAWIEQLDAGNAITLSAIVTPGLEPVARPYFATGQLAALAVVNGAIDSNSNTYNNGNIAALNLAQWFVAATLLVGAAYYLLIGLIRARRR